MKCCICDKEINNPWGNSPWPIVDDPEAKCCDDCNFEKVLPARIAMMNKNRENPVTENINRSDKPMIKVGDQIHIIHMAGEPEYRDKVGTVTHIDDIGQLHGTWGGLAIDTESDEFEILNGEDD